MIKNIVFFKSPKTNIDNEIDDPYYQNFKNDKYNTEFIKVLVIDYQYDNLKLLYDPNGNSDIEYFGIIFTSSNSIKSIDSFLSSFEKENIINNNNRESQNFFNNILKFKHIYIIGETSCNLFKKVFGKWISQNLIVVESNATDLAKRITLDYNNEFKENNNNKALLYFCGNQRREELPLYLKNNNIQLKELVTYQSQTSDDSINDILNLIKRVLQSNKMEIYWLVFFSPSGVDFVLETIDNQSSALSLSRTSIFNNNKIKVAAIGKTTENCLKTHNIKVDIVSPFPNAESLFSAISNYSNTE
ncbi:hypothetical protein ACTFIY_012025 [Dictyostelium cf. discoideum]